MLISSGNHFVVRRRVLRYKKLALLWLQRYLGRLCFGNMSDYELQAGLMVPNYFPFNLDFGGTTLHKRLHKAVVENRLAYVELLVDLLVADGGSAAVSQPDEYGETPICAAARSGHIEVVQWLVNWLYANDEADNVFQPAPNGETPVHSAAWGGHLDVVQSLVEKLGGSVTRTNNDGATPLLIALLARRFNVMTWLASNGGSCTHPNLSDNAGVKATVKDWSPFKILVACDLTGDAKHALNKGLLDPHAGSTLEDLLSTSQSLAGALWLGSPAPCPATEALVHAAMGHWTTSRHRLFHAGVRRPILVVMLCRKRRPAWPIVNVPTEVWEKIFSFFRRTDWTA